MIVKSAIDSRHQFLLIVGYFNTSLNLQPYLCARDNVVKNIVTCYEKGWVGAVASSCP